MRMSSGRQVLTPTLLESGHLRVKLDKFRTEVPFLNKMDIDLPATAVVTVTKVVDSTTSAIEGVSFDGAILVIPLEGCAVSDVVVWRLRSI